MEITIDFGLMICLLLMWVGVFAMLVMGMNAKNPVIRLAQMVLIAGGVIIAVVALLEAIGMVIL